MTQAPPKPWELANEFVKLNNQESDSIGERNAPPVPARPTSVARGHPNVFNSGMIYTISL